MTREPVKQNFEGFTPYTPEEMRAVIKRSRWIFAKSMPQCPHFYTLRREARTDVEFRRFVLEIRQLGYDERWGRYNHRYLDVDGWKYWTMGDLLKCTILINRAVISRPEAPAQGDLFSGPAPERERPWKVNPVHFLARWSGDDPYQP